MTLISLLATIGIVTCTSAIGGFILFLTMPDTDKKVPMINDSSETKVTPFASVQSED